MKIVKLGLIFAVIVATFILVINYISVFGFSSDTAEKMEHESTHVEILQRDSKSGEAPQKLPAIETVEIAQHDSKPDEAQRELSSVVTKPAAPTLEELKQQLLQAYNVNSWIKCKGVMGKNKELKDAYWDDIEYIIRIRQNNAFDKNGYNKPEILEEHKILLEAMGYIKDDRPTYEFKVTSLEEIKTLKGNLEHIMSVL